MTTETRCAGCDAQLPPSRGGPPRKWCSDRCRKITLYSSRCVDCGATINAEGRVTNAAQRCVECAGLANPRTDGRVEKVLEMVRLRNDQGLMNVEIARALDTPLNTVTTELHRMRALGFHVAVSPYRGAQIRGAKVLDEPGLKLGRELERRGIRPR